MTATLSIGQPDVPKAPCRFMEHFHTKWPDGSDKDPMWRCLATGYEGKPAAKNRPRCEACVLYKPTKENT